MGDMLCKNEELCSKNQMKNISGAGQGGPKTRGVLQSAGFLQLIFLKKPQGAAPMDSHAIAFEGEFLTFFCRTV